jgi:RNA polymerase-binding transcription factor DksA
MHELQSHSGGGESMTHRARRLLNARATELRQRLDEASTDELGELLLALERIEAGTWGQCEKCARAIGRDRLRALPETRCCIECAGE